MSPFLCIEITKSSLPLIALLNNGVTPKVEKKKTYFIFDTTWNSDFVPQIMTQREMIGKYDIAGWSPFVMRLKKL